MAIPHRKRSFLIPILVLITVLLSLLVGFMAFTVWCDSQQVFHDVTVELGQVTSIDIRDFLTSLGRPSRASFVTDPATIDFTKVGRTSLTLKHGTQKAVVNLIVEDTTAPKAEFLSEYTASVTDALPQAGALVVRTEDYSQVRAYYAEDPVIPDDYSDITVTVVVEDTSGNKVEGHCVLHFTGWLRESCTLELGQTLTAEMLLAAPDKDAAFLDGEKLKELSASLGEHTLTVTTGASSAQCTITVQDTTAPSLTLKNLQCMPGETAQVSDFVVSAEDLSGEPTVSLVDELPDPYAEGIHTIAIEATDSSGNVTRKEATLWISGDRNPPKIQGADKEMTVEKGSSPDFLTDVTASDDVDGTCDVTLDTSGLDMSREGTYTITYSAMDSAGNVGTCQRSIIVK